MDNLAPAFRELVREFRGGNGPVGRNIRADQALLTIRPDRCYPKNKVVNRNIWQDETRHITNGLLTLPIARPSGAPIHSIGHGTR